MPASIESPSATRKPRPTTAPSLQDQANLAAFWTPDAPGKIRKGGSKAYLDFVAGRKRAPSVAVECRATDSPLTWGLSAGSLSPNAQELLEIAGVLAAADKSAELKPKVVRRIDDGLSAWRLSLVENADGLSGASAAIAAVAAAHILPWVSGRIDAADWWQTLESLIGLVGNYRGEPIQSRDPLGMLAQQWVSVELPLTLAFLFPEAAPLRALVRESSDQLTESAEEFFNGEGLLHGQAISALLPLTACWTRLAAIGSAVPKTPWTKRSLAQYGWLVRQAIRWSSPAGRPFLGESFCGGWSPDFLQAALKFGGDRADAAAAENAWGRTWVGKHAGAAATHEAPASGDECEWSCLAVLRTDWSSKGASLAVDYSGQEVRIEAVVGKQRLFCGSWRLELAVDGQPVDATGGWEQSCWFSDADVDFLELALDLGDGRRIDRQMLLARKDRILYLADYFITRAEADLQYAAQLPLSREAAFQPQAETRDGLVTIGEAYCRVLPLGLAEWRTDPRGGELAGDKEVLGWSSMRRGTALAAPLLIDLNAARSQKTCTWRQLTVAELLDIKSPDVAVAYRAQSGKDQWLFYRSNGKRGNRTFLGQNTASEFVAGRFCPEAGTMEEFVEIEG